LIDHRRDGRVSPTSVNSIPDVVVQEISTIFLPRRAPTDTPISTGTYMDNAETLVFGSGTDAGKPEYHASHVGRAKYANVLSGERDEVVGWGYDE
jgi:hypothetical protein